MGQGGEVASEIVSQRNLDIFCDRAKTTSETYAIIAGRWDDFRWIIPELVRRGGLKSQEHGVLRWHSGAQAFFATEPWHLRGIRIDGFLHVHGDTEFPIDIDLLLMLNTISKAPVLQIWSVYV